MKRALVFLLLSIAAFSQTIPLSTSKRLPQTVPGDPHKTNSFPVTIALSPDQKHLAVLNNGFGTKESNGQQSIAILNLETNELRDFPDPRLGQSANQTYFLGLAWSTDGREIYASMASLSDPEGKQPGSTGNGIAVYTFAAGKLTPARFLKIPLQPLPKGKRFTYGAEHVPEGFANPYPAGLAVLPGTETPKLLVANNLADNAIIMNAETGEILNTFDLSSGPTVPSIFPVSVAATRVEAFVSLWNSSQIARIDPRTSKLLPAVRLRDQGSARSSVHPSALQLSPAGMVLYAPLSNADEIAVIVNGKVVQYLSTKVPGGKFSGAIPMAVVEAGNRLYVADAGANAVAAFQIRTHPDAALVDACPACTFEAEPKPIGFIPTQWYPTALAVRGNELLIATGKGTGPGPNAAPATGDLAQKGHPYIASLLHGSIARVNIPEAEKNLKQLTQQVLEANLMRRPAPINFGVGKNPIKHVLYIIKENRTYDQVFGDLKPGNGDPSLTLYGWDITPNQHKLAQQFGILDNFYDSGEVSGNGHVWSTAATSSDYTEKTWQIVYRGGERMYDFEGKVGDIYPLHENIPDINEPRTGYLWANAARSGLTYRHYGEYVDTQWCTAEKQNSPASTGIATQPCPRNEIKKGENLPEHLGGGPSPWPWSIPMIADNIPTKAELRGHFDPHYADFRMEFPDQLRVDEFLREFKQYVTARETGKGEPLPSLIVMRLPNDHTAGTRAGMPTPSATVADNDLALGRLVEAISHSPYWDDTAILALEDDAQDGADHVDAHRSIGLVISKYSQSSPEKPRVDSTFHTTVSMIRTLELLLGMPPMNNNDSQAEPIQLFAGKGTQPNYKADYRNRDNGMIYAVNPPKGQGAKESAKMDFEHADSVDTQLLNAILWRDRKGNIPIPKPVHNVIRETKSRDVDDDD